MPPANTSPIRALRSRRLRTRSFSVWKRGSANHPVCPSTWQKRFQLPSPEAPRLNMPSLAANSPMGLLVGWSLPSCAGTSPSFR
ncbi:Uncharacterised protein [Bordetella pertussis]|nr:Uncharacterised protein [Bordetella pertussis]CFP10781.1 Uncharacterised protein [Bordetella pertussis]CFU08235.1 Uncharacterised protein [Bordetella pertussis]CFW44284.1 Uncharacterised protein [Bordetella pertussis]